MVWRQAGFIWQLNVVWYQKYDCIIHCGIAKIDHLCPLAFGWISRCRPRLRKHCQIFLYSLVSLLLSTACNALAFGESGKINTTFLIGSVLPASREWFRNTMGGWASLACCRGGGPVGTGHLHSGQTRGPLAAEVVLSRGDPHP